MVHEWKEFADLLESWYTSRAKLKSHFFDEVNQEKSHPIST